MSLFDYETSRKIASWDYPFGAVIMTAIRQADSTNADKLQQAFPEIFKEFTTRYKAPGGILEDD